MPRTDACRLAPPGLGYPVGKMGYIYVRKGDWKVDNDGQRRRKAVRLHRWVVEQVEGRKLTKDEVVRHTCDTPACFLYEHLIAGTIQENVADRQAKGRQAKGERQGSAKLTKQEVDEIRNLHKSGLYMQRDLAKRFGMGQSQISRIVRGTSRKEA